jgi:quinol monooxygenase YgiN
MIVIAGKITVKPETRDEAVRVAQKMSEASRAEAGCHGYAFFASLTDPNAFFIFEEWEDDDALARHFQTPHMAEFQAQIPRFVAGPLEIKRYVVGSVTRLM